MRLKILIFPILCLSSYLQAMPQTTPVESGCTWVDSLSTTSEVLYEVWEKGVPDEISKEICQTGKEINLSFRPTQLIVPVSLLAVGVAGHYSKAFRNLNEDVKEGMDKLRGNHYFRHDDWIQYLPSAGYLILGFKRNKRCLDFKERILVEATAYVCMTAMVNVAKYSLKEKRPGSQVMNSFPSGHTATAFTGAELIRAEFGWGMGGIAYAISTGVAFLRLYNNRHWLNDVIAGAGIGILSARIGYWILPLYRKLFHWDVKKNNSCFIATPAFSPDQVTFNIRYSF